MGYISADEFFYYLLRQIRLFPKKTKDDKGLRRIIIDDIQKIDYSFPLIYQDQLFLTALISICKDADIDLLILCDKNASKVKELRSLADNVICLERLDEKDCRVYVERYAGYNSPSHIFGGMIKDIKSLFYCDNGMGKQKAYYLRDNAMEPLSVPNMDHFWVCNDTNKLVKSIKIGKR